MKTLALTMLLLIGCASTKNAASDAEKNAENEFTPQYIPGPKAIIYKTVKDYNNHVPVLLSEDKSTIVSYPHPNDITLGSGFPLPTLLHDGYLLDNRGIGKHVAFLKLTYQEYSQLTAIPSLDELYSMILDKDPLVELCDCGNKRAFSDAPTQLNQLIDAKKLRTTCKTVK